MAHCKEEAAGMGPAADAMALALAKACAVMGTHSPEDLQLAVEAGKLTLFERGNTLIFVSIEQFPRRRICEIVLVAGSLSESWEAVNGEIWDWAKSKGCDGMLGRGRNGWGKSARGNGWNTGTIAWIDFEDRKD